MCLPGFWPPIESVFDPGKTSSAITESLGFLQMRSDFD